jgi:phosphoglucosamine mutase
MATEGADVIDLDVLPTPGVAHLAERRGVPGAMVSASHNPFGDNGIKLFSALGTKLPVEAEAEVERELESILEDPDRPPRRPTGRGVGRIIVDPDAVDLYRDHLLTVTDGGTLAGLDIVVDCANGAASVVAPEGLAGLGATVTTLHDDPDGININDKCGSTDPGELSRTVTDRGADLGLALDGDADRVIAVDHTGAIVDGDVLLALFALDLADRGQLAGNTVVVTVMTNLGFRLTMEGRGIAVRETDVGDRHVLAALDADGLSLGGEQSGHIIFRSRSTTGDGTLTGIVLADLMRRSGRSLANLAHGLVVRVPQVLVNVPIPQPGRLTDCVEVWDEVAKLQATLGTEGRVLLRASGTEPLVRVMVEARDEAQANAVAAQLAGFVEAALGLVGGCSRGEGRGKDGTRPAPAGPDNPATEAAPVT